MFWSMIIGNTNNTKNNNNHKKVNKSSSGKQKQRGCGFFQLVSSVVFVIVVSFYMILTSVLSNHSSSSQSSTTTTTRIITKYNNVPSSPNDNTSGGTPTQVQLLQVHQTITQHQAVQEIINHPNTEAAAMAAAAAAAANAAATNGGATATSIITLSNKRTGEKHVFNIPVPPGGPGMLQAGFIQALPGGMLQAIPAPQHVIISTHNANNNNNNHNHNHNNMEAQEMCPATPNNVDPAILIQQQQQHLQQFLQQHQQQQQQQGCAASPHPEMISQEYYDPNTNTAITMDPIVFANLHMPKRLPHGVSLPSL